MTVLVLAVAFPQTRHLSTLFTDGLEISLGGDKYNLLHLPVTLLNFGLVAFVFGSIVQEFWRGVAVRRYALKTPSAAASPTAAAAPTAAIATVSASGLPQQPSDAHDFA